MNNQPEDLNQEITRKSQTTNERINNQNSDSDQEEKDFFHALSLCVSSASRPHLPIPDVFVGTSLSSSLSPLSKPRSNNKKTRTLPQSLYISPFMEWPRGYPTHALTKENKGETVPALFPWATTRRATVHNLNYLLSNNITTIIGEVQCKKCEKQYKMGYELMDKFLELRRYIAENKDSMKEKAPSRWLHPVLPTCKFCNHENSAMPVIPHKKRQINWLFLLLGQLLGCCKRIQLKYFCKHTINVRVGVKDRLLFRTYLDLCLQLDPDGSLL